MSSSSCCESTDEEEDNAPFTCIFPSNLHTPSIVQLVNLSIAIMDDSEVNTNTKTAAQIFLEEAEVKNTVRKRAQLKLALLQQEVQLGHQLLQQKKTLATRNLHLFRLSPLCVSNESLNFLPEGMRSHIGCICLAFLYCVFSNVSSNGLPEKMHSHIGCICLTFLHCVFSNVSSNRLPEQRHIHIDCICMTFLQCVFSCVIKLLT